MLSHDFQNLLLSAFLILIICIGAFGVYCYRRSKSYVGTGRVSDIERWAGSATLSWIISFCLSLFALVSFI
ncbi:hypothetical protein DYU05_10165 [Mucilaginibacter terrenus]|uniref:Uncharacterized protein n=1 Tax=Mucilaginibacter terrenus TaxID=2482727 RepID=A0A3E2NY30_9SPHI|nr:hypothetical protein DYU05_10165 [Mucilaginibacter terrenus]